MGRSPCCDENGLKKGPWTPEEDEKLRTYIQNHGHGSWRALPKYAGLNRCGKSCRLRWTNYLRPDIKRGNFSEEEERTILHWHSILGNKWSSIASHLSGRTDNEIKNFWNTHLKKKLIQMGIDPMTHKPRTDFFSTIPQLIALANNLTNHLLLDDHAIRLQAEAMQLRQHHHLLHHHSTTAAAPATSINPYGGPSFESTVDMLCTALPPNNTKETLGLDVLNSQQLLQLQPDQSQMLSQLSVGPHQVQEAVAFSSNNIPTPPQLSCDDLAQLYNDSISLVDTSSGFFSPNPPVVVEVDSTTTSCGGGSPSPPDWLADYNF